MSGCSSHSRRQSAGDDSSGGAFPGLGFFVDDAAESSVEVDQIQNRMAGIGDKFDHTTTMAGNHIIDSKSKPEFSKTKRLFVGDSVEFCPSFTTKTESNANSAIEADTDVKDAAVSFASNSVQTTGTESTDSIVSSATDNNTKHPKRKAPSPPSSSFSSLASESETAGEEPQPPNKKGRPLFKRKLRITLNAVQRKGDSASKPENRNDGRGDGNARANDENQHCNIQKPRKNNDNDPGQITIQQLLLWRSRRSLESQAGLSLPQLKERARRKARANRPPPKPSRSKRKGKKGRKQQKASAPDGDEAPEPVDEIEMNTGTLLLFRGERPRAKFVWRR